MSNVPLNFCCKCLSLIFNNSAGLNFGAPSTAAPTLNFGAPATTSTGLNFSFSTPGAATATTTATTGNIFQGLGGLKPPTTTIATATATPTTTTASVGLGGITTQQTPTTTSKPEIVPKEQALPNEIMQTVEQFNAFIKEQKTCSSEVSRCCVKEYWKMEEDLEKLQKVTEKKLYFFIEQSKQIFEFISN